MDRIERIFLPKLEESDIFIMVNKNHYTIFNLAKTKIEYCDNKCFDVCHIKIYDEYEPDCRITNVFEDPEEWIKYLKDNGSQLVSKETIFGRLCAAQKRYDERKNNISSEYSHELGVPQGAYAEDAGIYGWDLD